MALLLLAGCAPGFLPGTADARLREIVDARSTRPADFAAVLTPDAEVHRAGQTVRGQAAGAEALASLTLEPGAKTVLYRHHEFSWIALGDRRGLLVQRRGDDHITRVVELPGPTLNDPVPWQGVYYSRAWNEDDDAVRLQLLKPAWAENGRYVDATNDWTGVEGVSFMVGRFRKLVLGTHVKATTGLVDAGGGWMTWDWVITSKPGSERALFFGFDTFHLDSEGKIDLLVGFVNGRREGS